MKNPFPLLLVFVQLVCFFSAEAQYGRTHFRQRSAIDLVIGGDFGFHLISGNTANPEAQQFVLNREGYEQNKLNYRFGLNYHHGITRSLTAKIGIRYANPGFVTSPIEIFDPNQDINTVEKVFEPFGAEYRYEYQMIALPLGVKYTLANAVCEPYFEAGVSPALYLRTEVQEKTYEGTTTRITLKENMNQVNFIGFASVGGNLNLTQSLSGFTQLVGRYQFNSLRKGPVQEQLMSFGLEVGLRYYL